MTAVTSTSAVAVADPAEIAVAFARVLRGVGLNVPMSCSNTFAQALTAVGIGARDSTYWAGRSTLVRRPEDIAVYDRAFAVFFEHREGEGPSAEEEPLQITIAVDTGDDDSSDQADSGEAADEPTIEMRFSATEVLRHKDFADYSADELTAAHELMTRLRLSGSPRDSLRLTPSKGASLRPDLRRTVRAAIRAGGEPIERHFRAPSTKLRRLVLLLDVSGSMEPYARGLIRFVHAAVAGRQKVEAFAIGTRLTRVTRELTSRDPDVALTAAADRVHDWSGGTRLGEALQTFNDQWGVRGLARNCLLYTSPSPRDS